MNVEGQDFTEERWTPYLSKQRGKKAADRKREEDRQLYLGAEILLNRSLELACPDTVLPALYERNPYGKPYLMPPDQDIYVNWSHSGTWALCVVADREAGVDLQGIGRKPKENLVNRVLQPVEREFYELQQTQDQIRLFYQYWALKESFLKALGTGFQTPLTDFYIDMRPEGVEIVQKINEKKYQCRILELADKNYAAAICCEGKEPLERVEIEYL